MEAFIYAGSCRIVVAESKDKVLEVVRILENAGFPGVLGLVDADFDRIQNTPHFSNNILSYENHDLETMLIFSPALDRVVVEFGSADKIAALGEDVLDALVRLALPVGYLRLHSLVSGLNLRFHNLNYSSWVDRGSFSGTAEQLVTVVKNHSQRPDLSSGALTMAIRQLMVKNYSVGEVCEGTDLIEILSIGLRGKIGSIRNAVTVRGEVLRRTLRVGYSRDMLEASIVGKSIRSWEIKSGGFQILMH